MSFSNFAQAHGLIINSLYPSQKIKRCPTVDKPRSTNGAYFFDGERGWVFRWDAEATVQWWHDPHAKPWTEEQKAELRKRQQAEAKARREEQARVAVVAEQTLAMCELQRHGYLTSKGFPDALGLVMDSVLHVPMRNAITNKVQGLQRIEMIDGKYTKKFMYGQASKDAVLFLGDKANTRRIFCEGYSTGLSIQAALKQMKMPFTVVVCFSAKNMRSVAALLGGGYVFADNDKEDSQGRRAGQDAAKEIGLPWVMSDTEGEDANDLHQRAGLFALCKKIQELFGQ